MILLMSGKRKSGKDYVAEKLCLGLAQRKIEHKVIRISSPLKSAFAAENGINFEKLMTSGPYKEMYRDHMVKWGENKRNNDAGYFIRLAMEPVNKDQL